MHPGNDMQAMYVSLMKTWVDFSRFLAIPRGDGVVCACEQIKQRLILPHNRRLSNQPLEVKGSPCASGKTRARRITFLFRYVSILTGGHYSGQERPRPAPKHALLVSPTIGLPGSDEPGQLQIRGHRGSYQVRTTIGRRI